jgi:hypothetical protein
MRTGVDILHDRVPLARVEMRGPVDDAPNIRLPVAAFRCEHLRRLPSRARQRLDVSAFDLPELLEIAGSIECGDRSLIHTRPGVVSGEKLNA